MSFILDALKRSERARRVLGAAQSPPPGEPLPPPRRGWVIGAIVALLLVNAALLAWFVLAPSAPSATPNAVPQAPQGEVRSLAREAGSGPAASGVAPGIVSGAAVAAPRAAPDATPLADVEPALRARLAGFHVDVHGWADDPAQRFVLINLKRRVAGDALDGGIALVEIVPEGVVVELDGQRVLLPRQ